MERGDNRNKIELNHTRETHNLFECDSSLLQKESIMREKGMPNRIARQRGVKHKDNLELLNTKLQKGLSLVRTRISIERRLSRLCKHMQQTINIHLKTYK